ncbi:MAG: CRISPR-associated endoribonuclease Cas6 [Sulfurovum sp.]|nr:MAG: CRISPR-associated endoribonuclease Cas6 [Sulfurovum sp.]
MKYFELICTAYIKKDITFKESFEVISKYISYTMAQTDTLKEFHKQDGFKYYSFDNFYPIEKEKVYKQGERYTFRLRSLDEKFIDILSKTLRQNIDNSNFLVLEAHKKIVKQFFISELYSVTPVIVTAKRGIFWTMDSDGDILHLQRLLHDNLEKKYQSFYNESLNSTQNFIQLLEIKNRVPQSIWTSKKDKNKKQVFFKFFGNKFRIVPNEDEVSQKLAFVALACGLGEKNSFGGGFCLGKGMRV